MPHSAGCQTKNGCERSIDVVMISIIFGRMGIWFMYEYRECQSSSEGVGLFPHFLKDWSRRMWESPAQRMQNLPSPDYFLVLSGVLWLLGTRRVTPVIPSLNQLYICRPPMWIQKNLEYTWVRVRTLGNKYPAGDYFATPPIEVTLESYVLFFFNFDSSIIEEN